MVPEDREPEAASQGADRFVTTQWSMVVSAGSAASQEAAAALERLCRSYWYPLYAYVRYRGYDREEARDLTQGFFLQVIAKGYLSDANPERGRFRTFLLTALGHYLANEWHRAKAQKRGGGAEFVSLDYIRDQEDQAMDVGHDVTPERIYDRRWAEAVLARVLERLRSEYDGPQVRRFDVLKPFLTTAKGTLSYAAAATQLGMTEPAVKSAIHRMRLRWQELMREEIAQTLNTTDRNEVEAEIRYLLGALA